MREIVPIAGFNGVAPGVKATLKLPTDRLYNTLVIDASFLGNRDQLTVEQKIKLITLSSGGQTIRQFTPARLNYINRINGGERYGFNGYLVIHFSQPWLATVQAEDIDALGTAGMVDLTLDVDLADDADGAKLECFAAVTWGNRPPGSIVKMLQTSITPAQSGEVDITTLRRGPSYSRIHFFSANVTQVEVQALGRLPWKADKQRMKALCAPYGITPEADVFTLPFNYTQQQNDTMPTIVRDENGNFGPLQDLNIKVTVSSGGVVPILLEIREPLR